MNSIIFPLVSLIIGFLITFNISSETKEFKEKTIIKYKNNPKVEKEINKKEIEFIPEYIKRDIEQQGIIVSDFNKDKWDEFLRNLKKQNFSPFIELKNSKFLYIAARQGNIDVMNSLLDMDYDINEKDDRGYTAILYAIESNASLEFIKYMIQNGADLEVNKNDLRKYDALTMALRQYEINNEVVDYLLNNGFDIKTKHISSLIRNKTPNGKRYKFHFIDNIQTNNIESKKSYDGIKHILTRESDNEVISYLLNNKVDFQTYPAKDLLTFVSANKYINSENFEKIINSKAFDVNKVNFGKVSPLMVAALKADEEKVRILLENGAKINLIDVKDNTVYDWLKKAKGSKEEKENIKKLLDKYKLIEDNKG